MSTKVIVLRAILSLLVLINLVLNDDHSSIEAMADGLLNHNTQLSSSEYPTFLLKFSQALFSVTHSSSDPGVKMVTSWQYFSSNQ